MLLPLWLLAGLNIVFGLNPSLPLGMAEAGARAVLGVDLNISGGAQ